MNGPLAAEPLRPYWDAGRTAWYARALDRSGYAERVLECLSGPLREAGSVLDVGAGSGALAIRLLEMGKRVTALDPSGPMLAETRRRAAERGLEGLVCVEEAFEAAKPELHDAVVCANVPRLLESASLRKLDSLGHRLVALVVAARDPLSSVAAAGSGLSCRGARCGEPFFAVYIKLLGLGVYANLTIVDYTIDLDFETLDEAVDFWASFWDWGTPPDRSALRKIAGDRLREKAGRLKARLPVKSAVVWWAK